MCLKTYKKILAITAVIIAAGAGSISMIKNVADMEAPTATIIYQGAVSTNHLESEYRGKNTRELLYESLQDEHMQELYITIRDCLLNYDTSVEISSASRTDINNILYAVLGDHPEIFWMGGYEFNLGIFSPIYSVTNNEKATMERSIREQTNVIIASTITADGLNNCEKVRLIYDYLITNTLYGESERDQEIDSVILNHESVCAGYAKSFAYLMDRIGIPCACISSESHMYNVVELDGMTYLVDVTGGDAFEEAGYGNYPDYSYLICSNTQLKNSSDHHPLPICGDLQYACVDDSRNYYTEFGLYAQIWKSEYLEQMKEQLNNAGYAAIKCVDEFVFANATAAINEYFVADDIRIILNDNMYTITVISK